jgi:hypothetical protein
MGAFVKALGSASIYGEPADPAMVRRRSGQRSDNGRRFSNRPKGEINHNQTVVMFGDVSDLDCYFLLGPIRMRLCGRASRRVEDRNTLAGPAAAHRPRQSAPPPPAECSVPPWFWTPFRPPLGMSAEETLRRATSSASINHGSNQIRANHADAARLALAQATTAGQSSTRMIPRGRSLSCIRSSSSSRC